MIQEGKNFSVLLVKKDLEDFHFLKKSLEENETFPSRIDLATTFEEALDKLKTYPYHLLLFESEEETETEADLQKIQSKPLNLPFVLLLPIKDDQLLRLAMRSGVSDVIVKSESHFKELAQKLRKSYRNFHQRDTKGGRRKTDQPSASAVWHEQQAPQQPFSIRDELTGLYSHGYLFERVTHEFSRATRYNYPVSCIMLDLDGFKKINEDLGYYTGEKVLKEVAKLLFQNCRMSDFVVRYSGKEFCMILPHSGYEGARELASRLKGILEEHVFLPQEHKIRLTVSVGISSYPEDVMSQRADLIRFAAEALLSSKAHGRNHLTLYKDLTPAVMEGLPSLHISEDKIAIFQRRMAEINTSFRKAYLEASKALIMALESKDKHTAGHSASTAKYAYWTAQAMGLSRDEADIVRHGTLLHDIGKICIPDSILLKPGRLTIAEFEVMKQHAFLGYKILKPIKFLQQEALVVLHHHEWFNGEGYPCRLKGTEIPLGARIAGVADSFDTIRSAGARYKRTITIEEAVVELISCAGTQFDPEVVKAFITVLKSKGELVTDQYSEAHLDEVLKISSRKAAA